MNKPTPRDDWPASWKMSYGFDRREVFGEDDRSGYALAYERRRRFAFDTIKRLVPSGCLILDVAGAQGNFSLPLAEAGYRVVWNDIREDLAGYVQLKYEYGNVHFAPGNILDLDLKEPADLVLIAEVIEHVAHPDQFLARAAELARPGGYVLMTTPNGEYWRNDLPRFSDCPDPSVFESSQFMPDADGHIFLLHRDEIFTLAAQAGLHVERVTYLTNSLTNGHIKLSPALRILPPPLVRSIEAATTSSRSGRLARLANTQMIAVLRKPS